MPGPIVYEIRVVGHLSEPWSAWFDGLEIAADCCGETILHGPVADQAALHGILIKIRDLGMTLVSVRKVDPGIPGRSGQAGGEK